MSKTIQHKRSSVAGNKPDTSQIAVGEIAINFADRLLFTKDASGNIVELEKDIWRRASEPDSAREGDLWYNTSTKEIYFYNGDSFQEIGVEQAAATVDPSNTTSTPAFSSGTGTSGDPFILSSVQASAGDTNVLMGTITVSSLDANQSVPFQDLNSGTNGSRFSASNTTADASGNLTTNIVFDDAPTSTSPTTYAGQFKLGSASVYIDGDLVLSLPLEGGSTITNPGGTGIGTNTWNGDNGSTLGATGDLLLSTDGVTFSSSITVNNGDTYYVKWAGDPGSGTGIDGAHGTTITGTITDDTGGSETITLTIDKETTFEFQTGVDSDAALSSTSTSSSTTISGINSYIYPFGSSTGTSPEYSKNGGSYAAIPASNSGDATHYVENGDVVDLRHVNSASNNTESVTTLNMASHAATYTTVTVDVTPVVATPSITAPATDGETGISVSGPFTSSAFAMAAGSDTHTASSWEVSSFGWTGQSGIQMGSSNWKEAVAWNGSNLYVAVGANGTAVTSSDGVTWTNQTGLASTLFNNTAYDITWDGSQFLTVSKNGYLSTSPDGVTWTNVAGLNTGNRNLRSILYSTEGGSPLYVTVGKFGINYNSQDGITWTEQSDLGSSVGNSSSVEMYAVTWNGSDQWVTVGTSGLCATSTNPKSNWDAQSSLVNAVGTTTMYDVVWSGTQYCTVGFNGACATSPDGVTWTNQPGLAAVASVAMRSVVWDGSQFVAGGSNGKIVTSPDGVTWTLDASGESAVSSGPINDVIWDGSQFLAVGGDDDAVAATGATTVEEQSLNDTSNLTSWSPSPSLGSGSYYKVKVRHHTATLNSAYSDARSFQTALGGSTWTSQGSLASVTSNAWMYGVAWDGSQFVAVGQSSKCATSPDGVTWTNQPGLAAAAPSSSFNGIVWNGSQFVAVGDSGKCATSSDGITWTYQSDLDTKSSSASFQAIAWNGNHYFAVGDSGAGARSQDGVTWDNRPFSGVGWSSRKVTDIVYDDTNDQFVAVADNGEAATVTLDSLGNGNWTLQTSLATAILNNGMNAIAWSGSVYVAAGNNGYGAYSSDGVTWTVSESIRDEIGKTVMDVTWTGNQFVAVGHDGACATSLDGVTWTNQPGLNSTLGNNTMINVTSGGGTLLVTGASGISATS